MPTIHCSFSPQSQPIDICNVCLLGERSALMGLSTMRAGSVLAPMAQGAKGMTFESGKTYFGNPADAYVSDWRRPELPGSAPEHREAHSKMPVPQPLSGSRGASTLTETDGTRQRVAASCA